MSEEAKFEIVESYYVEAPEQAVVLLNPLRAEILSKLMEPASAAEVARQLGETPQRINYHLKALEKVGLARRTGTRQVRNLVEVLFQAIARHFVLAESLGWSGETVQKLKDQGSLAHLITLAERIKRDALQLMERSDQCEPIPSASLDFALHLPTEQARQAFLAGVQELVAKFGAVEGEGDYQVLLAVYPETKSRGEGS